MIQDKEKKGVLFACIVVVTILLCSSLSGASLIKNIDRSIHNEAWYWLSSYQNYAPSGVPDIDQRQDQWKKINPGPNGMIDSTVAGDDILNTDENCIAPGNDCYLNSTVAGDDVEEWAFCGPVSVANTFWWIDSQFSDPAGSPGDGNDQFALVQDYEAGDDHASANAPLLVERLAKEMNTTQKGTTYVTDMQTAITNWFNETNLSQKFTAQTINRPTFEETTNYIEHNQNVILLLGSYDYLSGPLTVDQAQLSGPRNDLLQTSTWWDYQSFVPTVQRLDALQILLVSNSPTPCDIQINIYDTVHGTPLGTVVMNPGLLVSPTWVQFHFTPFIRLTPGSTYYFDVLQLDADFHYEWFYDYPNPYPPGQGWMNNLPNDPYGHPFDWTFKTEYLNPPPSSVRREGHFVTCAGVNFDGSQIAFSDPTLDIANTTLSDHNDARNVSHDIYNVSTGAPQPDIDCQWWLPTYQEGFTYTVVEQAVIIAPIPDTTPPTVTIVQPTNKLYFFEQEIMAFPVPVIIGGIEIIVNATDADSGIDHTEIYIDNQLKANISSEPYSWMWSEKAFFIYMIKAVAYDKAGNSDSKELQVWKFF
jgi:hypothetical protein